MTCLYSKEELLHLDVSGFSVLGTESGVHCPAHWHTAIELSYCARGQGTCRCGERQIPITADTLLLIPSLEVHSIWSDPEFDFLCIHIEPKAIDRFMPVFSQFCFDLEQGGHTEQAVSARKQLIWLIQELTAVERLQPEGYQLKSQSLLFDIATLLVRHFSIRNSPKNQESARSDRLRLEPLINYVQQHHSEELTLEHAAAFMGLNKEYFCRLFKRTMGVSFIRYLNTVRVIAIARDLANTDSSIASLMERHGFTNQKLFHQMFQEFYGCTPSQKRKATSA